MYFKASALLALGLVSHTLAHCVITSITGANGVTMPGLTVIDGTPRDCPRYEIMEPPKHCLHY